MSVVFITDVSVTLRGFQANYIAVYVPSTSEFHCENECTLCLVVPSGPQLSRVCDINNIMASLGPMLAFYGEGLCAADLGALTDRKMVEGQHWLMGGTLVSVSS